MDAQYPDPFILKEKLVVGRRSDHGVECFGPVQCIVEFAEESANAHGHGFAEH